MDIEEFEASVAGTLAPPSPQPGAAVVGQGARTFREGSGNYSVFVPQNNNPKLLEIISELRGIPAAQARQMTQQEVIPIVQNIPQDAAEAVRRKLAAASIPARVQQSR